MRRSPSAAGAGFRSVGHTTAGRHSSSIRRTDAGASRRGAWLCAAGPAARFGAWLDAALGARAAIFLEIRSSTASSSWLDACLGPVDAGDEACSSAAAATLEEWAEPLLASAAIGLAGPWSALLWPVRPASFAAGGWPPDGSWACAPCSCARTGLKLDRNRTSASGSRFRMAFSGARAPGEPEDPEDPEGRGPRLSWAQPSRSLKSELTRTSTRNTRRRGPVRPPRPCA